MAESYGATAVDVPADEVDGLGLFDVTVDTSGRADLLAAALRVTGPCGHCTCTAGAVHRSQPVALPVYEMYMNVVTFHTGWVHTRSLLSEPLELISDGVFDPVRIAQRATIGEAVDAFAQPFSKLILTADDVVGR